MANLISVRLETVLVLVLVQDLHGLHQMYHRLGNRFG
jgi:hypothetical protein